DGSPLLVLRPERAVERGRRPTRVEQLARELDRHRGSPGAVLGKQPARDALGQLLLHHPQGESHVVPAEVAQAAEWFEGVTDTDVTRQELVGRLEAELAGDAQDGPDRAAIVERRAQ